MVSHASQEQTEFDFLVIFSKPMLRCDEVQSVLRKSKDTIYELADRGDLEAHQPDTLRAHRTFTRRSLVAYVAKTARYEPADFLETLFSLIRRLTPKERALLLNKIQSL